MLIDFLFRMNGFEQRPFDAHRHQVRASLCSTFAHQGKRAASVAVNETIDERNQACGHDGQKRQERLDQQCYR